MLWVFRICRVESFHKITHLDLRSVKLVAKQAQNMERKGQFISNWERSLRGPNIKTSHPNDPQFK